jgi:7-carboxy-7-deazaguanine synthase
MTVKEIVEEVGRNVPFHHITVTGGEPLMQSNTIYLLRELAEKGYNVQLETNGSFSLAEVPQQIRIIADVKTPCSGEAGSFFIENVKYLKEDDEVKFVISDMADYEFSRNFIKEHLEDTGAVINFSPVHGSMEPSELSKLIIRERLNVRLNLQLHKVVGFD